MLPRFCSWKSQSSQPFCSNLPRVRPVPISLPFAARPPRSVERSRQWLWILALVAARYAVLGRARRTHLLAPHLHLEGRAQGVDEVELADRADVLAEGRALEDAVHHEGAGEEGEHQRRGQEGTGPQVERLIGEEEQQQQADGEPLPLQPMGPASPARKTAAFLACASA